MVNNFKLCGRINTDIKVCNTRNKQKYGLINVQVNKILQNSRLKKISKLNFSNINVYIWHPKILNDNIVNLVKDNLIKVEGELISYQNETMVWVNSLPGISIFFDQEIPKEILYDKFQLNNDSLFQIKNQIS